MKRIPSKQEILDWVAENPKKSNKRDIGRAFGIKGAARIDLKRLLKELADEGLLEKERKNFRDPEKLPPVSVLRVTGPDKDGDLVAVPMEWGGSGPEPKILMLPVQDQPALGAGDRVLGRLTPTPDDEYAYTGRLIRRIGAGPQKMLGLYRKGSEGGRIVPIDKKSDHEWMVADNDAGGARDGELVEAEQSGPRTRIGLPRARVVERLGDPSAPKSVSLIAIHNHGIPDEFPADVVAEANLARPVVLGEREDLRDLPLITIDPADARDHDDAIFAELDKDPKNFDGFVVWVAIADVAHYVQSGSKLDAEAKIRGNSTYFPDRVVPMLPDNLSGALCSLHEGAERPCIALRIVLDSSGKKLAHRFVRGLMASKASLNYQQVQAAADGVTDAKTAPLLEGIIKPLFAAFNAVQKERNNRQPLHLDLPERKIVLSDEGKVVSVAFQDRLDAHKLVEEFMVLSNVCAAETLEAKKQPLLYRVHEEPSPEKLDGLRQVAKEAGMVLAKGQVLKTAHLNKLLDQAAGTEEAETINMSVLRSMTQAYYAPSNFGHFGLALRRYAHFTSPIRRYADLVVHRSLISAHGWGEDGLAPEDAERLVETGEHISQTERRSMLAERDTNDRYLAAFLSERVGNEFVGRVSGIARFGLFVKLKETGADGLIPISSLGREYFHHDAERQTLTGEKSRIKIALGQSVTVRLAEAVAVTGGLVFELLSIDGKALPRQQGSRRKSGGGRKLTTARKKRSRKK